MSSFPFPTGKVLVGSYELAFECNVLGEQYEARAQAELRETPDVVEKAIRDFVKLLKEDEDLVVPYEEEWLLYQYLRPTKFYPNSAYKRIKNFYRFRAKNPKLVTDLVPTKCKNILLQDILTVLPMRDQHGCRMLVIQIGHNWDTRKCTLTEIWRGLMLALEVSLMEPRTQVCGSVIIFDLAGFSMNHVWQMSPSFAKNFLEWVQGCIAIRLKATHIVNQPYIFNMAFSLFKPFIGEKLRNRLYFHGQDRASLLKHIDSKCLPEEYGGDMQLSGDYPRQEVLDLYSQYNYLFEERLRYGYVKTDKSSS